MGPGPGAPEQLGEVITRTIEQGAAVIRAAGPKLE